MCISIFKGRSFPRPILTFSIEFAGFIYEGVWNISSASRSLESATGAAEMGNCSSFNAAELMNRMRQSVKVYRVNGKNRLQYRLD